MGDIPVLPRERTILPPFVLPDEKGLMVDVESFRQRRNLIVVITADITPELEKFLQSLSTQVCELADEEAVVVTVVQGGRGKAAEVKHMLGLSFTILTDERGDLVRRLAGSGPSVYVTDRFREIFAVRHGGIFSIDEVLEWLAHINRQCPE